MSEKQTIIQDEHTYVVQSYVRPDIVFVRGEGTRLYDDEGNTYDDWVAGIAVNALGYNDTGLQAVIQEQVATGVVHVSNLYHTKPHVELAKALCESSFANQVFFCNSGAEANEGALKFARKVAFQKGLNHKTDVVCFTDAFHGRTLASLSVTPKDKYQKPFKPLMQGVKVGQFNDIESAEALIDENTVAVIVEPIQGEGGIHVATDAFLKTLRQLCDKYDATLIFDEVQSGVGRSGTLWAYEASGVTPDIMTLAKPLAGGLPIGAILVTESVGNAIQPGDHGSTFAGGLVVTKAGAYVLDRIRQPEFLSHVQEVGTYLMDRLSEINSPHIKEVRGRGLMVAVEFEMHVSPIIEQGYAQGLLLVNAGTNVLRFVPPLVVTKDDVDSMIDRLTTILETIDA